MVDNNENNIPEDINVEPGEVITPQEQRQLDRDLQKNKREDVRKTRQLKRESKKKRVIPILRYYNSDLAIPVNRTQLIPGNYYIFKYRNFKHCPTPICLYIGSNPRYSTMEGINMQYLSISDRKRVEGYIQALGLHTKHSAANGIKIKNINGEERHIYRNSYSSDSIYKYLKKKMKDKIYFYRRYKYLHIDNPIYVVPIEGIDRALEIISPITPFTNVEKRKIKTGVAKVTNIFQSLKGSVKRFWQKITKRNK